MLKQILAIILGYAIFVVTSLALFKISGKDPHADATNSFIMLTAIYGGVFSFISGLVAQLIARTNRLAINYILALILAGFASFSLFKSGGSHWTQLLAIFLFAPISIAGGLFHIKKFNNR